MIELKVTGENINEVWEQLQLKVCFQTEEKKPAETLAPVAEEIPAAVEQPKKAPKKTKKQTPVVAEEPKEESVALETPGSAVTEESPAPVAEETPAPALVEEAPAEIAPPVVEDIPMAIEEPIYTEEEVRKALLNLKAEHGKTAIQTILSKFGVSNFKNLVPDQYPAVMESVKNYKEEG